MNQSELQDVRPGFDDPVAGSQSMFRLALQALSRPGRVLDVPTQGGLPVFGQAAAAQLLLALLDSDCSLWLSPSLRQSDAPSWLRFHTGCRVVHELALANFVWLAESDERPALAEMRSGSDEYPDQSATCVMELSQLDVGANSHWQLSGPGIEGTQSLSARGLPADFHEQWRLNHAAFPRGVDLFLTTSHQLVGLPRSTRLDGKESLEA